MHAAVSAASGTDSVDGGSGVYISVSVCFANIHVIFLNCVIIACGRDKKQ